MTSKLSHLNKKAILTGIFLIAIIGAGYLVLSSAASPTATASCGARVQNYTYQVPWGNAVWNQPVCNLPRYPQSADYASRFYKWANFNDGTAADQQRVAGRLGADFGFPRPTLLDPDGTASLFSRNVYDAADATTTTKVHAFLYDSNLDGIKWNESPLLPRPGYKSKNPDTPIPWNPNWKTGEGGDNEIVILDKQNGKIYEISGYKRNLAAITQCGIYATPDRICTYTVNISRDYDGNVIDYRTFEGPTEGRGVGLGMYQTFTTPEEVAAGEIRHALGIAIPSTSYGPVCTQQQLGTSAEGKTCGTAVAPATKIEWGNNTTVAFPPNDTIKSLYTLDKTIPEGMRFALDIDDAGIESWLNGRTDLTNNPRKKETVRIFARALRDYGFIIADTSGNGAGIQVSGSVNPKVKQQWNDLGILSDADGNIFDGLITSTNLYVVDPPTVTCVDGTTSKNFCKWTSAKYATTPTNTDTTNPTVTITSPSNGSSALGTITISANASDNVGVTRVELIVDGSTKQTKTATPYSFSLDSTTLSNGSHTITVKAYDAAGNSNSKAITINVNNTAPPPAKIGDFDADGKVGLADLAKLLSGYNKNVTAYKDGDCDGNGYVNLSDLAILLSNYGK